MVVGGTVDGGGTVVVVMMGPAVVATGVVPAGPRAEGGGHGIDFFAGAIGVESAGHEEFAPGLVAARCRGL